MGSDLLCVSSQSPLLDSFPGYVLPMEDPRSLREKPDRPEQDQSGQDQPTASCLEPRAGLLQPARGRDKQREMCVGGTEGRRCSVEDAVARGAHI